MKVKLNYVYAGPRGVFKAGQIVDLPDAEARGLIEGRYADVIIVDKPLPAEIEPVVVETTELPSEPENTAIRTGKPKAKKRR